MASSKECDFRIGLYHVRVYITNCTLVQSNNLPKYSRRNCTHPSANLRPTFAQVFLREITFASSTFGDNTRTTALQRTAQRNAATATTATDPTAISAIASVERDFVEPLLVLLLSLLLLLSLSAASTTSIREALVLGLKALELIEGKSSTNSTAEEETRFAIRTTTGWDPQHTERTSDR